MIVMANNQIITLTQLIAPGLSSVVDVTAYKHHTVQYTIATINTSVDVNVQGSLDGNVFFDLESSDVTRTANGTFFLNYKNLPMARVKFNFVAEVGGTTATIDVQVMSSE